MHSNFSFAALTGVAFAAIGSMAAYGADEHPPCVEDAMIVFDGSGSMSGDGWGYGSESAGSMSRIDKVRAVLSEVLPNITRIRRVGLITFGPGPYNQCNVKLDLPPTPNAASQILDTIKAITPAGKTPLTSAVGKAAGVLDYRHKPGLIVVLTDGEETCGGKLCDFGTALHKDAADLTVHVISLRVRGISWMGEQSALDAKCLAEQNNGLYLTAETQDELKAAIEKTLGCPMMTEAKQR
jgi:Ca-activated chloride channel family protein